MQVRTYLILLTTGLIFLLLSCGKNPEPVNRADFLQQIEQNIIAKRFEDTHSKIGSFDQHMSSLLAAPSLDRLKAAQASLTTLYQSWKGLEWINFGPAKIGPVITMKDAISLWPIDTARIDQRIASGLFEFDDGYRETRGILALEYLLYSTAPNQVVDQLNSNSNYTLYIQGVTNQIQKDFKRFFTNWKTDYASKFIAADGTAVSESTSLMYNAWLGAFEQMKDMAILAPFGLHADYPEASILQLEARHSQQSLEYFKANYNYFETLYYGVGSAEKYGWRMYMQGVEGGVELSDEMDVQMKKINQAIADLPADMSFAQMLKQDASRIKTLANALQGLTPLIRGKMSSLLGISITFSSSDGD